MSKYRIVVQYDSARSVFTARAPELHHISGEGATRSDALARIEEEIDAQVANAREGGGSLPPPVDGEGEESFTGELTAKVSRGLHRELAFQARAEGVELPALVGELCAQGLEARRQQRRRPAQQAAGDRDERPQAGGSGQVPGSGQGPGAGPGNDRRQQYRGGQGGRYHAIMEDRATFLEYVRGLESGGGPPRNRGDRRRGPTGGGGGRGGGTPGDEGGPG